MTDLSLPSPAPSLSPFATVLSRISLANLRKDTIAGLTVAAISLPQSMAYALVAGVDPRLGLYTAMVFTAIAGIFGSSRHLVNGPTGAVSLVTFSALAFFDPDAKLDAYEAMFLLTVMMGMVQIFIGVTRLGDVTRYISESVVIGFIAGAGFLTAIGQVSNALGVKSLGTGNDSVLYRLWLTVIQGNYNWKACAITVAAIALAIFGRRFTRAYRLPQVEMLVAVLGLSALAFLVGWSESGPGIKPALPLIEAVPAALPSFHVPQIKTEWLFNLSSSAVSIGILGLLEALAIAKAVAHDSRQRLDYNRQCIAEGIGNLAGGFFQCMPGSGSLSRTAINWQAGAVTRFSGIFTAIVIAVVVLSIGPLAAYIPKAVLAGLLIVASLRLVDIKRIRYTLTASVPDAVLLALTALSAVFVGVDWSILIGATASILWYLVHASRLNVQELVVAPEQVVRARISDDLPQSDVAIYDLEGDLFFGAAPELHAFLENAKSDAASRGTKAIVLRLKRVRNPDAVALEVLDLFLKDAEKEGLIVFLAGLRPQLTSALERIGIAQRLGEQYIFPERETDYSATLAAIRAALAQVNGSRGAEAEKPAYYLV
jgi:sulfate permease, SulP family